MKKINVKKYQEVKVVWQDAMSDISSWSMEHEFSFPLHVAKSINCSIGYFIKIHKDNLFICRDFNPSDLSMSGIFSIPVGCVLKIIRMKE